MSRTRLRHKIRGHVVYQLVGKTAVLHAENAITDVGRTVMLNAYFSGSQLFLGYTIAFIDGTGFTGTSTSDTVDSHPGWTTFSGYTYNGSTLYNPPWPSANYLSSSNGDIIFPQDGTVQIVFTQSGVIQGIVVSDGGDRTGWNSNERIFSTALFDTPLDVSANDILNIVYSISVPSP